MPVDPFSEQIIDANQDISNLPQPQSALEAAPVIIQSLLASFPWIAAAAYTTSVNNSSTIRQGLKAVQPSMLYKGIPSTFFYNIFPVETGIEAQKKFLGENASFERKAASIFVGAGTEAIIGNPLDYQSLSSLFRSFKTINHFRRNPQALAVFEREELLKLFPSAPIASSKDHLIELAAKHNYENMKFNAENFKMIAQKTGVTLTFHDAARSVGAMFLTSIFRNAPFYYGILRKNESGNSSDIGPFIISLGGAFLSVIPSNANYDIAARISKGEPPLHAFQNAIKQAALQSYKKPDIFAFTVAIRTLATFASIICFSDTMHKKLAGSIDYANEYFAGLFGVEHRELSKDVKEEIDKTVIKSTQDPAVIEAGLPLPQKSPNTAVSPTENNAVRPKISTTDRD